MNYANETLTLTFSYDQWAAVKKAIDGQSRSQHQLADRLVLDSETKNADQIRGLRRKATSLFGISEDIGDGLADVRERCARSEAKA